VLSALARGGLPIEVTNTSARTHFYRFQTNRVIDGRQPQFGNAKIFIPYVKDRRWRAASNSPTITGLPPPVCAQYGAVASQRCLMIFRTSKKILEK
jgi:hypothetical protein